MGDFILRSHRILNILMKSSEISDNDPSIFSLDSVVKALAKVHYMFP